MNSAVFSRYPPTFDGRFTTSSSSTTNITGYQYGNRFHATVTTNNYGGQTFHYARPRTSNTIICFPEVPAAEGMVFDAAFIAHSLKTKYRI